MSIFRSISQALKTRKVESPLFVTLESMADYLRKSGFSWSWVAEGDLGVLERGFGRSFSILLNKQKATLTVSEKRESSISFLRSYKEKEYKLSAEQEREFAMAISDAIVNAPPAPEQSALAALLGLVLLLIAIAARRNR